MQLIFLILIICNVNQILFVRSTLDLFETEFANNLINLINEDLFNSNIEDLKISLEENKQLFLNEFAPLLADFSNGICNLVVEFEIPKVDSIFQMVENVSSNTTSKSSYIIENLAIAVANGLKKFSEYLINIISIQTEVFNGILMQEKKLSTLLRTYVNLQFEYFEGTASEKIYVDSFVNSANICMEKLIAQVSSNEFSSDYLDCNGSINILSKKLNDYAASGNSFFSEIPYIKKIFDILQQRKSTISSILNAKKLIDFYTEAIFEDIVNNFVNDIEICIKDKISEMEYIRLLNLIDTLTIDLSFNELNIQKRIDIITKENIAIQEWINSKFSKYKK